MEGTKMTKTILKKRHEKVLVFNVKKMDVEHFKLEMACDRTKQLNDEE